MKLNKCKNNTYSYVQNMKDLPSYKRLEDKIKQRASDKELVDTAIQSRAETGLYNKDKVARAIANPDSMKSA